MPKLIKPEKVTGIVAMSYLVLIPAAAVYIWRRVEKMDGDLTTVWRKVGLESADAFPERESVARGFFQR